MNLRIKQLSVEAAYGVVDPNGPFTAEEFVNFQQKFAELIVQECILVIEENAENIHAEGTIEAIVNLEKHFGVE